MDSGPFRFLTAQNRQSKNPALMSRIARALIHSQLGRLNKSRITPTTIRPMPNHLEIPFPEPPERFLHILFMPSPPIHTMQKSGGSAPGQSQKYASRRLPRLTAR